MFFTLNREDFSFVIHLDRQPLTSRRREAQTGSRARSGSRSERTLDAVEHSRTLMEWWPVLIFHRGGLRIKVINNNGWRHSCSCHETSTWPRVCPDSIRNFGSIPPPRSDSTLALEAGLLRGRLRSVEATPPRPTSNELEVATLGFDDHRSSALRSCSPSGYEFAPSRACPWARRSPRRPLSGVGAELSVLARTPIPSSPPSWPRSPLSSVAVSDRLGRLPRP